MIRLLRLSPLACLLASTAALADHPFILPSNTSFSGENAVVTFDAASSDHVFFFDHRPIQLTSVTITRPDGTAATPYNGSQMRFRSVFDLKLDQQGTWKVATLQTNVTGSFKQNGEERRVGGRGGPPPGAGPGPGAGAPGAGAENRGGERRFNDGPRDGQPPQNAGPGGSPGEARPRRQPPVALEDIPADATDVHLTQTVNRVETFVTAGAPTTDVFKPSGNGLELAPVTHPNSVAAGETAQFRFLIDGKPAAGVKVTVLRGGDRYREEAGAVELSTSADGLVSIKWPEAGMYWIGAEAEDKKPSEKRAEARRMSYAATLEVMTP